jgi:O-antigen/teichoic acid export membrane protein
VSPADSVVRSIRHKFRPGGLGQDTLWAMAAEAAQLVSSLIGLAFIVKKFGVAYTGYLAVYGVIGVAGPPITGGLILAVMHHAVREKEDLVEVARSALTTVLVGGGLVTTIAYVAATHIVRGAVPRSSMALIMAAEIVVLPIAYVASATMQAHGRFAWCMQIRIAPLAMRVLGLVTLKALGAITLPNVAIVLVYSYLAAAIPALVFVSSVVGRAVVPGRVHLRHLRSSVTYGEGMSALSAQNDGDKVALDHYRWAADGARYGLAYRLIQIGFAPINGLLSASHTRFLGHDEGATDQHVRRSVRFATISIIYGTFVSAVVYVAAPIVPHLLGPEYAGSVTMMRVLSPVVLLRSLGMFPLNGIIGLGRIGLRTLVLVFGAVVAVTSYVLLVPHHSWKGAVVGSIISEGSLAAAAWVMLIVLQRRHNASVTADPSGSGRHSALVDVELAGLSEGLS